ncbi:MAG TPA: peptide chain release factor N(5)-glutamine methyltransferase [Solirubrobacteraceae bacterium]
MAEAALAGETIATAVAWGRARLQAAGCDTPRLDAELLLSAALGVGRERLVLDRDLVVGGAERSRFADLVARREAREPVAYILGHKEFRRLTLAVDRRVLIPRPETELLVEVGLDLSPGARVADVGTGSGAVALALADERPDLFVRGLEVDPGALAVAVANRDRLGLAVALVEADLLDGAAYDAVLANLPYVPAGTALEPEIARFEPPGALFAGPDGLDVVRRLVEVVGARRPRPLVALEIGPEQASRVVELLSAAGFGGAEVRRDLAGLERVVVGTP